MVTGDRSTLPRSWPYRCADGNGLTSRCLSVETQTQTQLYRSYKLVCVHTLVASLKCRTHCQRWFSEISRTLGSPKTWGLTLHINIAWITHSLTGPWSRTINHFDTVRDLIVPVWIQQNNPCKSIETQKGYPQKAKPIFFRCYNIASDQNCAAS